MKTILITGSTDGIGKLTAAKLAKDGHNIYVHGRNANKVENVIAKIKKETGNDNIQGLVSDFSNLDAVRKMGEEVSTQLSKIDVLINNAGVYNSPSAKNEDGLDMRIVVNYLAPYVLTNGLLPLLEKSDTARIINLSSAGQSPVSLDMLHGNNQQPDGQAYAQSKLALTMWSFYLAKKEQELNVIAVNPGSLLNTKMVKEAFGNHWSAADKGAKILYDLAISEDYKDASGKYFDNDKGAFAKAHHDAYDQDKIEQLINATDQLTN